MPMMISAKIVLSAIGYTAFSLSNLVLVYVLLASPPIHLFYDVVPPAGPSSVYVPGSGFSGFWFHLGALQAIPNLHDYDFYCYSSGCLSVAMAAMNVSVTDAVALTYNIQQSWLAGNMSRFDIVDAFLQDILGSSIDDDTILMEEEEEYNDQQCNDQQCDNFYRDSRIESFLPRLNVLVTSRGNGVKVVKPKSRAELIDALKQTTWIPFITGEGVLRPSSNDLMINDNNSNSTYNEEEFYLDGGFSRVLHPICEYDLRVPNTWINMIYTLHPGLKPHHVDLLWQAGRSFEHPLLAASR